MGLQDIIKVFLSRYEEHFLLVNCARFPCSHKVQAYLHGLYPEL